MVPAEPGRLRGVRVDADAREIRVLYLFAGAHRKASVKDAFLELQAAYALKISLVEVDIALDSAHDLLDTTRQQGYLDEVRKGAFDAVLCSPPCNTWSRALYAKPGPRPVRNSMHVWGFPWLEGRLKESALVGNTLVLFSWAILRAVREACQAGLWVRMILEHPEDLGLVRGGHMPASIWQLPQHFEAISHGFNSVAVLQCWSGTDFPKPTRFLTNLEAAAALGISGVPEFHVSRVYKGPLPQRCGHEHKTSLMTIESDGKFGTSRTAAYPGPLNFQLAALVLESWLQAHPEHCTPCGAGERLAASPGNAAPSTRPSRICVVGADSTSPALLYVGRGTSDFPRSRWGNPFPVGGHISREIAIEQYEIYVRGVPALLRDVPLLGGKVLACHCRPDQPCHADVLLRLFEEFVEKGAALPRSVRGFAAIDEVNNSILAVLQEVEWPPSRRPYVAGTGAICLGLVRGIQEGTVLIQDGGRLGVEVVPRLCAQVTVLAQLAGFTAAWTSIQVNHNTVAEWHADSRNQGPSLLWAGGDYRGGDVEIQGGRRHPTSGRAITFDGRWLHRSHEFTGLRYSLVAFPHSEARLLDRAGLDRLHQLGFVHLAEPGLASPTAVAVDEAPEATPTQVAKVGEPEATTDPVREAVSEPVIDPAFVIGGFGEPLVVDTRRGARGMNDGAGLCSPGRWPPARRQGPRSGFDRVLPVRDPGRRGGV